MSCKEIAAGAITTYIGHASIETTYDLYGNSCPARRRKLQRSSIHASPESTPPRCSSGWTRSEVDLFDFWATQIGQIQMRL